MNWIKLLCCLVMLAVGNQNVFAGFIVDGFTTPPSSVNTNASLGQTATGADAIGAKREFNITAVFHSNVSLAITGGTATYVVTPTGASPSANMTLRYVDPLAANSALAGEQLKLSNVATTSAWNMTVTMKGTGSPATATATTSIPIGYSNDLFIPYNSFSTSPLDLGPLNDVQFFFSTSTGGQISLGSISITAVPEPAWLGLLVLALPLARRWREMSPGR